MPKWLESAVFYEIYPQSYRDSNGDGIGDFQGIIDSLDYIHDLGCNALWINPCFDSPFKDAGYDVRDYKKVAPRYGTNEDLYRLFEEAHKRGIHVLLDLVPGHTSEEHEWFQKSQERIPNEYSDRYVWTNFIFSGFATTYNFIAGESERSGSYLLNFFKCQPALNYGFLEPKEPWQMPADAPAAIATREAMKDVIRFWLDHGCDGFRVDMAGSLVKNDDQVKSATSRIWKNVREMLDRDYPEAAFVAEWADPKVSLPAGFHMDFTLNDPGTPYSRLLRDYINHGDYPILGGTGFNGDGKGMPQLEDHSVFKKDAGGDFKVFTDYYTNVLEETGGKGYIATISCNHDTVRPTYSLTNEELKLFYMFLYTLPGTPFIYYGDEIGMRYQNIPTKEGGYFRTGTRTPMQWSRGKNLGFSTADAADLYLPVDPADDAPNVEDALKDPDSLLNEIKDLIHLRLETPDLQSAPNMEVIYSSGPVVVYQRGSYLMACNTSSSEAAVDLAGAAAAGSIVRQIGSGFLEGGKVVVGPQSFTIYRI